MCTHDSGNLGTKSIGLFNECLDSSVEQLVEGFNGRAWKCKEKCRCHMSAFAPRERFGCRNEKSTGGRHKLQCDHETQTQTKYSLYLLKIIQNYLFKRHLAFKRVGGTVPRTSFIGSRCCTATTATTAATTTSGCSVLQTGGDLQFRGKECDGCGGDTGKGGGAGQEKCITASCLQ